VDPTADRMLAAARRGSNKAWAALIERADPECRRLAHLVLGGHDVDRALLSAYVRAYRARRKGPDDAVVFLTHHVWIACGHEIRRHQRREAPAPGRRPVRTDRTPRLGSDALGRAVTTLRPEERAIWGLVDQAGFPIAAVALALGVDAKVVTTVASRVARLLDQALEEPTGAMEVLDEDAEGRPDLGGPGEDTSAVMATEPTTAEAPPTAPDADPPDEDTDAGQLEPDPPTPGFWRELGRRLRDEREAPQAAPPPPLPGPGDPSPSLASAKAPPVAMQKRAPKKVRRRRPDVVEGLAGEVDRQRPRRHWAGILVKGAAIVVVLGVLGAVVTALYLAASRAESPVKGQTVADVVGESMDVLDDADRWSATIERESLAAAGTQQSSLRVVVESDGSYRVEDTTIDRLTTYDAAGGRLQDTVPGFPPRSEIGVALGPPDGGAPRDGFPLDDLGIAARTLASVDDEPPVEATLNGRDVYRLTGPLTDDIDLTYTVDADTLYPIRITWTVEDQEVRELRFADVALDGLSGPYEQDLPAGTPTATDVGFAPVGITEVMGRTDIAPLTPEYLPDGFVSAGVVVDEIDRITQLRYARGPQELLITLRPSPVEAGQVWDDPFPRPAQAEVTPTEVAIDGGPFRGVTALQVSGPRDLPSLWAADGELAFTVSGDVSAADLVRIARSLRTA
jgi:DNA-directed RNA polymerase specialized sigma24 family protein